MAWLAVDGTVRLRNLAKPFRRMHHAVKCVSACCDMDNVLSGDIEMVK